MLVDDFRTASPENFPFGTDDERRRNAAHAPFGADVVLPHFAVEILRPGEAFFLGDFEHHWFTRIEADADDLNPPRRILVLDHDHVIRLGHAWFAPGGPEIDDHHLAAQLGEVNRCAIDSMERKHRFVADFYFSESGGGNAEQHGQSKQQLFHDEHHSGGNVL